MCFQRKYGISAVGYIGSVTRGKINEIGYYITASAPSGGSSGTPAAGSITRNLYVGLRGADVTFLQQFLIRQGCYPQAIVSGFYGNFTAAAVKCFQRKYGISAVGYIGPVTRGKINALK